MKKTASKMAAFVFYNRYCLQHMIVRADVFIMPVLHTETDGDSPDLLKAQPLVQMTRMDVTFHHGVEL